MYLFQYKIDKSKFKGVVVLSNIVLTRIDDRLIHGQVMTAWVKHTNATKIYVVDDTIAKDEFMKKVLIMAAPPGINVKVFDIDEALKIIKENSESEDRIIILVKSPDIVEQLIDGGLDINEIILGGIGVKPGRKRIYKNISISEEEEDVLKRIMEKGVKIIIRIVPDDRPVPIEKILKR